MFLLQSLQWVLAVLSFAQGRVADEGSCLSMGVLQWALGVLRSMRCIQVEREGRDVRLLLSGLGCAVLCCVQGGVPVSPL